MVHFNIYQKNQPYLSLVEDIIEILQDSLSKRNQSVSITNVLNKNSVNIIIDEFTDKKINEEIMEFRKNHKDAVLVFLITEFPVSGFGVESLNMFGGLGDAAITAVSQVLIRLKRSELRRPTLMEYLLAFLYLPIAFVFVSQAITKNIFKSKPACIPRDVGYCYYMANRYIGLEYMSQTANMFIAIHDSILRNSERLLLKKKPTVMIYPEISNSHDLVDAISRKKLRIEISGTITKYRKGIIGQIDSIIRSSFPRSSFESCHVRSFADSLESSSTSASDSAFSLHPPQSRRWRYSSVTRIYRAIDRDQNIPILIKNFNQHPIEKLCLLYTGKSSLDYFAKLYSSPSAAGELLTPLIEHYSCIAKKVNDEAIKTLCDYGYNKLYPISR